MLPCQVKKNVHDLTILRNACFNLSILRNAHVNLSILRNAHVNLSILRNAHVTQSILRNAHVTLLVLRNATEASTHLCCSYLFCLFFLSERNSKPKTLVKKFKT